MYFFFLLEIACYSPEELENEPIECKRRFLTDKVQICYEIIDDFSSLLKHLRNIKLENEIIKDSTNSTSTTSTLKKES